MGVEVGRWGVFQLNFEVEAKGLDMGSERKWGQGFWPGEEDGER